MSSRTFALRYIAKAAAGVPRDLVNTAVSGLRPIRPTVLIYNCTFVCDARCEMCNNWKRGNRKAEMTLDQLDRAMDHRFWHAIENLNISGGEPTTRNDLPEMVELFVRRLPRMRKLGINSTGLTPQRAIPQFERIVRFLGARGILCSIRVSLDGIGEIHDQVRQVRRGFEKASQTIEAMAALADEVPEFQFGLAATIFRENMEGARAILSWARERNLDIVFNMLRFTDAMLGNRDLEASIGLKEEEEEFMRRFFLERVEEESVLSGQAFMYLHYADMIANGYRRTMPCPFRSQGLLLNPNGELFYCENSKQIGNVTDESAADIYFKAENIAYRGTFEETICSNCLSPCQVNVGAMKQIVPYARFVGRAYRLKRHPERHLATLPEPRA